MTEFQDVALFDAEEYAHWRDLWVDMPAYDSADETPFDSINVLFSNAEDRRRFLLMLDEDPNRRRTIWFPSVAVMQRTERNAKATVVDRQRYPIYIISKGRADTRLTVKALEQLGINYRIVVEPQEYDAYREHIAEHRILTLPYGNLGLGSIPARNFVWDHATATGARRHWILDDNISAFTRLNNNLKLRVVDENPFRSIEDWVDRYENVPMAGMNYRFFLPHRDKRPPLYLNTRVYSCILLTNELPQYRWRGRYNEDTDLSIRFLKDGYVTALFNHFLIDKQATMTMAGGNTDELYQQNEEFDGRRVMAESLVEQHPDIARVSWKWDRWQHHVDYSSFKRNALVPVPSQPAA